jgi:hypothetical protein
MSDRNKVFISYSHDDTKWLNAIKEQLAVLEYEGLVSLCEDTQLEVGEDWYHQLNEMMLSARLGLLLISTPFLKSKFIRKEEIPRLFAQHQQGGMMIYPLLVTPCPWERVGWLAKLQLRPQDAKRRVKAVFAFEGAARQQVLADVASEIARMVKVSVPDETSRNEAQGAALSRAEKSSAEIQKPLIRFKVIGLSLDNHPEGEQSWVEEVKDQGRRRVFERNFEVAADPTFDIMAFNESGGTVVVLKVGIRILQRIPQRGAITGVPKELKTLSSLRVYCHQEWKHFDLSNDQSWTRLPNPIVIKKNDLPYRFSLLLENFCDVKSASTSEIRFCLEADSAKVESESVWLEQ